MDKKYLSIVAHYEACLDEHGDSHLGLDWPKPEDAETRYRVMLDVVRPEDRERPVRLLDFGCGASHLYEHIVAQKIPNIAYAGLDLSEKFIALSKDKFPGNDYYHVDVLDNETQIPRFDYVVMNGVFTRKGGLSFDEMFAYFKRLLIRVFDHAEVGLAFNVMSKHVDWERDDLFHLSFDVLARLLRKDVSRNFVFRNDYGLYEYTAYVYR